LNILKKTISSLFNTKDKIRDVFSNILSFSKLTDQEIEKIEECLLSSDVGWNLTDKIIKNLKYNKNSYESWEDLLIGTIKSSIKNINLKFNGFKQIVIIIGVNGSGKTTSTAKIAQYLKKNRKNVTLVGADTYRAAAVEQLEIWSKRMNVNFISNINTSDPASIAFDGAKSGISKGHDNIIIDTAGRLHTSRNLMLELEKIYRVVSKLTNDISVCISIDGNNGQNAIKQVEEFNQYLPIDNIILNKMDGTAKGGIVLSILNHLSIPISYIGTGESYDDLLEFELDRYLDLLIKE